MYTFISRFFHTLHSFPRSVLALSLFITAISIYYSYKLELKFSLADVLPENFASVKILEKVEEKFGGLGKLTLILQSESAAANSEALLFLAQTLEKHPQIKLVDYKKESDFFFKNRLLYIDLEDLKEIEYRIENELWSKKEKFNPILTRLIEYTPNTANGNSKRLVSSLEKKYSEALRKYYGTRDEKTLIIHLFPLFDVSNADKCRSFFTDVKNTVEHMPGKDMVAVTYTGEVLESIQDEGRLLSEVFDSGWISIITIIILVIIFFFRIPTSIFLVMTPLFMGISWTLALTYFFIGHLSMMSLSLGIILLGMGLGAALHLMSRYSEERRKKLSAEVAFETITLETGPAITTSALTSAAAFFSITITDFKGFSEFGMIAGIGMICTLIAILLVLPCLMILLEPHNLIHVFGSRIFNHNQFERRPYTKGKTHLLLLGLVTVLTCYRCPQHRFEYNFKRLGFPNQNSAADSILQAVDAYIPPPSVIISSSNREAARVSEFVRQYKKADTLTPTIHSVMSLTDILPKNQNEKLKIISHLKKLITPVVFSRTSGTVREDLDKLMDAWDVKQIEVGDLPDSFKKKFLSKNNQPGAFTYIFPSVDLKYGLNCQAFADDTRTIRIDSSTIYYTSGIAVIYADLLNLMIPDTVTAVSISLFTVFILVFFATKSLKGTFILFVPILFGILWTMGALKIMDIKINYFNLIVLPAIIGIGMDNSVHIYNRYLEEGAGSLYFVLKQTGTIIFATSLTSIAGFFGLMLSSHQGLVSMGVTAAVGISLTFLASILFIPIILGHIDVEKFRHSPAGKLLRRQ